MVRAGITERRLKNRRFRKTEDAILRVFFEEDNYISLEQMAKKARVARSTIYRHHRAVREIVPDYEKYVLMRYRRVIRRMIWKKTPLKQIYFQMLLFILANRQVFTLLLKSGDFMVLSRMIDELKVRFEKTARITRSSDKIFKVYKGEVMVLIREWMRLGFNSSEMDKILENIMYLTETVKTRLGSLER